MLLGAILSPTDAVAVISILKKLGFSKRLTLIIEEEALFNDGVAVVAYSAILTAIIGDIFNLLGFIEGILLPY